MTSDNLGFILYSLFRVKGTPIGAAFGYSCMVVLTFVLMNLFLAVLIDGFSMGKKSLESIGASLEGDKEGPETSLKCKGSDQSSSVFNLLTQETGEKERSGNESIVVASAHIYSLTD